MVILRIREGRRGDASRVEKQAGGKHRPLSPNRGAVGERGWKVDAGCVTGGRLAKCLSVDYGSIVAVIGRDS